MKLDDDFSCVIVCPTTKQQLSFSEVMDSLGVCPRCGYKNQGTVTHNHRLVGKWSRPSLYERVFKGMKPRFIVSTGEVMELMS